MKPWKRWLYVITGLAALFVAVAVAAQAIRENSWTPVVSAGWLPVVLVASGPGSGRCCLPRRRRTL
jgi:hypothetical protein